MATYRKLYFESRQHTDEYGHVIDRIQVELRIWDREDYSEFALSYDDMILESRVITNGLVTLRSCRVLDVFTMSVGIREAVKEFDRLYQSHPARDKLSKPH